MNTHTLHTKTPWEHQSIDGGWDGIVAADGTSICSLTYNNPANASFIATAVNAYDTDQELIAALAAVLRWARDCIGPYPPPFTYSTIDAVLARVPK